MSETITVSSSTLSNLINNFILPFIRSSTIPSNPYISGTFNDFNCYGFNYSGSGGNTTTTGYYYTYEIELNTIRDVLNLQIIFADETFSISLTENTNFSETQTYSYFTNIALDIYLKASSEVYIPEGATPAFCVPGYCDPDICTPGYCLPDECCCGGCCCGIPPFIPDICVPDTCIPGLCFPEVCVPGECFPEVCFPASPSTFTPDLLIPFAYNTTLNATFNNGSISYTYSYGIYKPPGDYSIKTFNIDAYANGIPAIYLYNLQITSLIINANSISISNIPNPPNGYDISKFNNDFNSLVSSILLPYLNSFLTGIVFEFVFLQ